MTILTYIITSFFAFSDKICQISIFIYAKTVTFINS